MSSIVLVNYNCRRICCNCTTRGWWL